MGMHKIGRRQGPPSTRIPRRPCPPISRVLPNGHSKKQIHENQHKQKGMLRIMCVLGVQLAFLNIEGFCLLAAGKFSFVVICRRRCLLYFFTVVIVVVVFVLFCYRCLCLLFVQRQSCAMTGFLSAMAQTVQKDLGDRRRLETHR